MQCGLLLYKVVPRARSDTSDILNEYVFLLTSTQSRSAQCCDKARILWSDIWGLSTALNTSRFGQFWASSRISSSPTLRRFEISSSSNFVQETKSFINANLWILFIYYSKIKCEKTDELIFHLSAYVCKLLHRVTESFLSCLQQSPTDISPSPTIALQEDILRANNFLQFIPSSLIQTSLILTQPVISRCFKFGDWRITSDKA